MSQPTGNLPKVPYKKNPRPGQAQVFERLTNDQKLGQLNIQLPTGYGKTFTALAAFSLLQSMRRADHLLYIVPTRQQLDQLYDNREINLWDAGVSGPQNICRIREHGLPVALKMLRTDKARIFATTIQFISGARGYDNVLKLMETGAWMVVVDEYHHYGIDKSWSETLAGLSPVFQLSMSATPYRKEKDSSYLGAPDMVVTYRQAMRERAVKPVKGHAYMYRIDLVGDDGIAFSYTTQELGAELGNKPEKIEAARIKRKMRFTSKYVSPLVEIPITRMISQRAKTGRRLQAIIGAMSVGHAESVCAQVKTMFPELSVDWVGTKTILSDGREFGRDDATNREILKKFAPPKEHDGKAKPTLDVLIHVGMAGEGLDTDYISEVIHLNNASYTPQNIQENGRAARYLEGVRGNINFDSSSEFARRGFVGEAMVDAMDGALSYPETSDNEPTEREDIYDLPDEPQICIEDMELIGIDSGDPRLVQSGRALDKANAWEPFNMRGDFWLNDDKSEVNLHGNDARVLWKIIADNRRDEAEAHNDMGIVTQLDDELRNALTVVTGLVKNLQVANGARFEKSMLGDIKKRINTRKKQELGGITKDAETIKKHWTWVRDLLREIKSEGLPQWLA
jgi:superfamily II DNA or RNA helicase